MPQQEPMEADKQDTLDTPSSNPKATADDKQSSVTQPDYILNTSSKKYHHPDCHHADRISPENYSEYVGTEQELEEMGYEACKSCH